MLKKIVKDISIYAMSNIIQSVAPFLLVILLAKIFSPIQLGIADTINILTLFFITFLLIGTDSAMLSVYYDKSSQMEKNRYITSWFYFVLFIGIIAVVIIYFFANYISLLIFNTCDYFVIIKIFSFILFFSLLNNIISTILRINLKSYNYFFLSITRMVVLIIFLIIIVIFFKNNFLSVFYSLLLVNIVVFLVGLFFIRQNFYGFIDKNVLYKLLKIGILVVPAYISYAILNITDRYFVAHFLDLESLGIYSFGFKFAAIINLIVSAFIVAWPPLCLYLHSKKNDKEASNKIYNYFLFIVPLFAVIIFVFIKPIINIIANDFYFKSIPVVGILILSNISWGVYNIFSTALFIKKKLYFISFSSFVGVVLNILINIFLIKKIGLICPAFGTLIAYLTMTVLVYIYSQKKYYVYYNFKLFPLILVFVGLIFYYSYLMENFIKSSVFFYFIGLCLICLFIITAKMLGLWNRKEIFALLRLKNYNETKK